MSLVSFQTPSGAWIGFHEASGSQLVAGAVQPAPFELIDVDAGVALRSIVPGWFLVADSDCGPLRAEGSEVEARSTFDLADHGDGLVRLLLAGDHSPGDPPSEDADLVIVGSVVRPIKLSTDALPHAGCCCGPGVSAGTGANWEERTHHDIVNAAVELMENAMRDDPLVKRFIESYWRDAEFQHQLYEGLKSADEDPRYARPTVAGNNLYGGHFYDPNTRESYMPGISSVSSAKVSALSEGKRYFDVSVFHARRWFDHRGEAGRLLGLSLHFLTDLTQPMHAANFINLCGGHYPLISAAPADLAREDPFAVDWRHAWFELWIQDMRGWFDHLPPLTAADLDTSGVAGPETMLHEAAVRANQVFREKLEPFAFAMSGRDRDWSKAAPLVSDTLREAPRRVARFLKYWMEFVLRPAAFDQQHWYWVTCSAPRTGRVGLHYLKPWGSHFIRSDDTGDNTKFVFLPNTDGTFAIVCREWLKNPWYLYDQYDVDSGYVRSWLGEDRDGGRRGDLRTHFMPVEIGRGAGVSFYEPRDNLVVRVHDGRRYDGWLVSDEPCSPSDQTFHLEPAGTMTAEDHARIKSAWPDWTGDA